MPKPEISHIDLHDWGLPYRLMVITGACLVGMVVGALLLPWAVGLLLVGPLLGHASWHAYRDLVAPDIDTHLQDKGSTPGTGAK